MALNWNKINSNNTSSTKKSSSLDWSKINNKTKNNSANPTFKTVEEAKQYAKDNNIKLSNSNVSPITLPKTSTVKSSINTLTPEKAIDTQKIIKAREEEQKSPLEKFYSNVIEPTNNFMDNLVYGTVEIPGKAFARATIQNQNNLNKLANQANEMFGNKNPLLNKNVLSNEEIQQKVSQMQNPFDNGSTSGKIGHAIGNTLGYLGTAKYLGGTPLAYGTAKGMQSYGSGGDTADVAVNTGLGTAFGAISNKLGNVTKGALSKIGATNTNVIANAAKNFASGFAGMGGASLATGTASDIYNAARGREVDYLNTVKQSAIDGIIGGIMQGTTGTINDVKQAKAQLQTDIKAASENISNIQAQIEHPDASEQMKQILAKRLQPKIEQEIAQLANNKYLGQNKALKEALEQLSAGNSINTAIQNSNMTLGLPEYSGQVGKNLIDKQSLINLTDEYNPSHKGETYLDTSLKDISNSKGNSVAVIDLTNESNFDENGNLREHIADLLKDSRGKEIYIKDIDKTVKLSKRGINELQHKKITKEKVQAISKLEDNVSNSVYYNSGKDELERPGVNFDYTVSAAKTNNGIRPVMNTIMNAPQSSSLYNVDVLKKDTLASRVEDISQQGSQLSNVSNNSIPPANNVVNNQYMQNIEKNSENSNKSSFSLSENSHKQQQLKIIQGNNPMQDDYHTGIRNVEDIKTFAETLEDSDYADYDEFDPDYTMEMAQEALKNGEITVYSSYPIEQGIFVTPSKMEAESYSGNRKVYEKKVKLNEVAWIDPTQGQYAKVKSIPENIEQPQSKIQLTNSTPQEIIDGANVFNLEKPNQNLSTYKRQMFQNNANAINDLIKMKNEAIVEFNQKISQKKQELAGKKDKTTKVAQNLKQQINNLEKRKADSEAKYINKIDRLENRNATINKLKKQVSEDKLPTRKEVKERIITEKDLEEINFDNAKNLNKFIMNNTTPQRVNEKIFDKETANKINEKFFKPIKHNEAERIRFLNKERNEIKAWGIKPKSDESAAVQMYGEGEYVNPETGETSPYTLTDLKRKFPNDWEKIKNVAEQTRAKYDNYIDTVNKELNKMGYDSIPKLKNYFRHFEETKSLLDTFGIPSKANALPTDMNGLTADLKPGKNFFANALKRTGKKTTYDAITGIDGYLEGISKLIYHTEDIQNLRTLDEYIRGKYGRNADLEGLSKTDFEKKIKQIQEGHLSEYASWLTEYTNNIAGKKSRLDRGTEEAFGRKVYGTLNAIKKQVGSNLTGLNVNSALSNFISAGQGLSSTSKIATLQGLVDTVKNILKNDGFIDKSDFLTTRFGSDTLSKTTWENMSNAGQILMSGTDYFTANLITRSKYHEYLNKGYPEEEAIKKADEYADRLMAGRGLGDMPNFFNSKTLGIITQFQLENVNQFDSMFHDNFTSDRASEQTKYEAKTWNEKIKSQFAKSNPKFYNGLMSTFVLAQLFGAGYAFNKIVNKIGGTGGAFDPIGTIEDLIKDYQKDGVEVAMKNFAKNILDDIPYANLITGGGRIPMKDSLPNIYDLLTGESSLGSEAWKLFNIGFPTGGSQIRKTIQGAMTLLNDGEYGKRNGQEYAKWLLDLDNKDWLEKIGTSAQALLFGKYGPSEAKEYLNNGYKGLTVTQTKAYKEAKETGMSAQEFKKWIDVLVDINPKKVNKQGKEVIDSTAKKAQLKSALNDSELTDEQKQILYGIFYKVQTE